MTGFLTTIAIILGVFATWQLIRIYELSKELKGGSNQEEIPDGTNRLMANLFLLFLVSFFAFCYWNIIEYKDKLLPPSASVHGEGLDNLLNFNFVIIITVFVITHILLFYFAFKYYYRKDKKAAWFPHDNRLEMTWTIVPAIVMVVIIIYGLSEWNAIKQEAPEDSIVIELYSKQFDWTARYGGEDNLLGNAHVRFIEGTNVLGMDLSDERGHDDVIVKGEFHIPVNKSVNFMCRSQDVIHSAYMPHFRQQINTVPGMVTSMHFIPKTTTMEMREITGNEEFDYVLLCNKICGASHYNMQMTIIVESEEDYNKWLSEQKTFKQTSTALLLDNQENAENLATLN